MDILQSAMSEGAVILEGAKVGLPPENLPIRTDLEGPLRLVFWKDQLEAFIQCNDDHHSEYLALDFCKNTGNPFATHDSSDFQEDKYHTAPSGKTVTKEFLRVEIATIENISGGNITVRFFDYKPEQIKSNDKNEN